MERNKKLLIISNILFVFIIVGLGFLLQYIRSEGGVCVSNPCNYCTERNPNAYEAYKPNITDEDLFLRNLIREDWSL